MLIDSYSIESEQAAGIREAQERGLNAERSDYQA